MRFTTNCLCRFNCTNAKDTGYLSIYLDMKYNRYMEEMSYKDCILAEYPKCKFDIADEEAIIYFNFLALLPPQIVDRKGFLCIETNIEEADGITVANLTPAADDNEEQIRKGILRLMDEYTRSKSVKADITYKEEDLQAYVDKIKLIVKKKFKNLYESYFKN